LTSYSAGRRLQTPLHTSTSSPSSPISGGVRCLKLHRLLPACTRRRCISRRRTGHGRRPPLPIPHAPGRHEPPRPANASIFTDHLLKKKSDILSGIRNLLPHLLARHLGAARALIGIPNSIASIQRQQAITAD
jgi:hypothetical protein